MEFTSPVRTECGVCYVLSRGGILMFAIVICLVL